MDNQKARCERSKLVIPAQMPRPIIRIEQRRPLPYWPSRGRGKR